MKFQLSCFALVCALGLTACSSGSSGSATANNASTNSGSGSSSINKDLIAPTQNPNNQTPSTPSTDSGSSTPNTPTNITLGYDGLGHVQSPINTAGQSMVGAQPLSEAKITPLESSYAADKIIIDGREVDLSPRPYEESTNVARIESGVHDSLWLSKGFKHVRFGTHLDIQDMSVHKYGLLTSHFVFGDITPVSEIPHRGSATYNGIAIMRPIGSGDPADLTGNSNFNVDFYNKSITGSISFEPVAKFPDRDPIVTIPLAGTINGASFSGIDNNSVMYGHFYGPQAAELGGTFAASVTGHYPHEVTQTGSFGAKKQ